MSPSLSERRRAAVILFLNLLVPFLVITDILEWSGETVAAANGLISAGVTMFFLFLPNADA